MDIVQFLHSFRLFDLLFLLFLAGSFLLGFIQGTIRRILGIGSILFAFLFAANARDGLGRFFAENWHQFPQEYSFMVAFGLVFAIAAVTLSLVIQSFYKPTPLFSQATFVDELIGGFLGVVQGMFILGFAIVILDSYYRIPGAGLYNSELPFLRTFWESIDASGTVHIFRDTLIPNFFTLVGLFIPASIRALY